MTIRKLLYSIMLFFCAALRMFSTSAHANSQMIDLPTDMDQAYIVEQILELSNSFPNQLDREVTKSDIDLTKAYKIYVGTNIFELHTTNYNEILEQMEQGDIIYEVPILIGNDTVIANIERVMPVRDEVRHLMLADDLVSYEKRVGTWGASSVSVYSDESFADYYETASRVSGRTDVPPVLLGGLPGFRMAVAIYPDKLGNIGELVLTRPESAAWDSLGLSRAEYENKALDYSVAKNSVLNISPSAPGVVGGYDGANHIGMIIMLLPMAVIAFVVFATVKKLLTGKRGN